MNNDDYDYNTIKLPIKRKDTDSIYKYDPINTSHTSNNNL